MYRSSKFGCGSNELVMKGFVPRRIYSQPGRFFMFAPTCLLIDFFDLTIGESVTLKVSRTPEEDTSPLKIPGASGAQYSTLEIILEGICFLVEDAKTPAGAVSTRASCEAKQALHC